jgi:chromosome segregation ATPase
MIKVTKLQEEEFTKVQDLQKEFQSIVYQIGELNVIKYNITKQLDEIETEITDFYSTYNSIQDKEKELISQLKTKYPDTTINFETGEIS